MDTVDTLTIACIVLVLTNVSFALLANHWRRRVKQSELSKLQTMLDAYRERRARRDADWQSGKRHGIGLMYKIAVKAHHEGRDVLEALRAVGREQLDIPIVQVPDLVSHETADL